MKVGILSLQGAVLPHQEKLSLLGVEPVLVRTPEHLSGLSGIILPGGESSTMIHLLGLNQLWNPLKRFVSEYPAWGICAGAILLANRVTSPSQDSLGAIEISVERNAYGRQSESFIAELTPTAHWPGPRTVEGVFIRAPRFTEVSLAVQTLFTYQGEPVMVRQGKVLASAFHPELTTSTEVHEYFLKLL